MTPTAPALSPFYKWAGGKRRLLPHIERVLAEPLAAAAETGRYFEPFLGGGAVYFALGHRAAAATLNDRNPHIAATMIAVRDAPDAVLDAFNVHAARHSREHYYSLRPAMRVASRDFGNRDALIAHAARFLYMNKATYNGLYRENASGGFNAPFGDGRPVRLDAAAVHAASTALQTATIRADDFTRFEPQHGDVVYCDPPYLPVSKTASFTGYTAGGFVGSDQLRLALWCRNAAKRGAFVVVSNAGTSEALAVFRGGIFGADEVVEIPAAPRVISCKGALRDPVPEYLFVYRPR